MRRAAALAGALWLVAAWPAAAELRVLASTTDLKSLVEAVGGGDVMVDSLVPAGADAEAFEPKLSDLARLRAATLIVRVGLGYDAWVDRLIRQAGDTRFFRGGAADVDASVGIPLLEVVGRGLEAQQSGHAHGAANPHYWLDPANADTITAMIAAGIGRVAPALAARVAANRLRFLTALAARTRDWQTRLAPYEGAAVIAYHSSWPYFARRFRLNIVGVIEPKPGIAPSPAHLARLVAAARDVRPRAVLHEPFEPVETARLVATRTGAPLVVLAPSVGSVSGTGDYIALLEHNVAALARALASAE
ncbi:MAG: zinc ABC transporter substrate-binding protein [Proteobacteria bacterium]|nr:zinc ABC transporter substrate-binding protein [Pseudomonadota bacterium]